MEVHLGSSKGQPVASPAKSIDHFAERTRRRQGEWAKRLADDPDAFAEIEQEIDQHYRLGGGHLVAALLGKITSQRLQQLLVRRSWTRRRSKGAM